MIRVGFDGRASVFANKSGVENYITDLVHNLPADNKDIHFYVFLDKHATRKDIQSLKKNSVSVYRLPTRHEKLFWKFAARMAKLTKLDLFHFPISMVPDHFPTPAVITIYDLTYELHPEYYSKAEADLQKREVKRSAVIAKGIITISNATKHDLQCFYGVEPNRIYVTYLPVRSELVQLKPAHTPLKNKYIVAIGNIQPRKNFVRLIDALAQAQDGSLHLVIAGKFQDEAELSRIKETIKKQGLSKRVHLVGHISDQELVNLYHFATALLFVSTYEGYGYPIIEAFHFQTPVITSDVSAMAEIAGDAALRVDPNSTAAIAAAIDQLIGNKALQEQLIAKGQQRLKELTGRPLVEQTCEVYKKVLKGSVQ